MLPIFIHHELDEKPQTGGKPKQKYVKCVCRQAEKYSDNVILFGDESNKAYCDKWVDVTGFTSEKWEEFLSVFENYSTYPDAWAKGIFKRFFIFEDYMQKSNIQECIILDSDVLIYSDFVDVFKNCDVALEIPEDQSIKSLGYDNDLCMAACAGLAYMTYSAICDFTLYCIEKYKNKDERINKKWDVHKQYNLAGGICEMTLLYLWFIDRKEKYNIVNLGNLENNVYPILVINENGRSYLKCDILETKSKFRLKNCLKVELTTDLPLVFSQHRPIKCMSLHFGGKTKMFIEGFVKKTPYSMTGGYIEWVYWEFRNYVASTFIGEIKRKIFNANKKN